MKQEDKTIDIVCYNPICSFNKDNKCISLKVLKKCRFRLTKSDEK